MSKHTPGPWTVDDAIDSNGFYYYYVLHGPRDIDGSAESKANARLIAAAPDLLKALKDLISTVEASDNDDDFVKAAIAAIKKAEGGELASYKSQTAGGENMSDEIPIAEPMRAKRQCQRCGGWERCVYVKTKEGFRRVCIQCAHAWRDAGVLLMPDRVWPMKTKEVF